MLSWGFHMARGGKAQLRNPANENFYVIESSHIHINDEHNAAFEVRAALHWLGYFLGIESEVRRNHTSWRPLTRARNDTLELQLYSCYCGISRLTEFSAYTQLAFPR